MSNRTLKLINPENSEILKNVDTSISDFAQDTSNSEIVDSGILLDDLNIMGSFNSYHVDNKKVVPNIPTFFNRNRSVRTVDNSDTFIKPMIKLNDDDLYTDLNKTFYFIQTRFSDEYNKKMDQALDKNILTFYKSICLYHDKNKYDVKYYIYKKYTIARVPNIILNNNEKTSGFSWYLLSPVKGKVFYEDNETYFVPDKTLYSGVSYRNAKSLINNYLPEAIVEKTK
ncbi:MAG: hypothetical protein J5634_03935 [Bacilli bacterium]|nr:hypothetical protein [Bacilli bacterium]